MDIVGILKEAWQTTWRNKALWVLGFFVSGSAGASSMNWQMDASQWRDDQGNTGWEGWNGWEDWDGQLHLDNTQFSNEVQALFNDGIWPDWMVWVIAAFAILVLIGIVFWVVGIAARGGLIDQTDKALAGETVSVRAGWRKGFSRWGRVFAVGFLLGLPFLIIGLVMLLLVGGAAIFLIEGGEPGPGLIGVGLFVPLAMVVAFVIGIAVTLIREVSFRHAILGDVPAFQSIKTAWGDLLAKRGLFTMWLVMVIVGLAVGVATALVMVPIAIVSIVVIGGGVASTGPAALWMLVPMLLVSIVLGALYKSVWMTFQYSAWTAFYRQMGDPAPETVQQPVPDPVIPPAAEVVDGI